MAPRTPTCHYADGLIFMDDFPKQMQIKLDLVNTDTGEVYTEYDLAPQDWPNGFPVGVPVNPTSYKFYKFHSDQLIAEC